MLRKEKGEKTEEKVFANYRDATGFRVSEEQFGPLWKYMMDENIAGIEYNGRALWLTNREGNRVPVIDGNSITEEFVKSFMSYLALATESPFNRKHDVMEIYAEKFSVVAIFKSVVSGYAFSIKKKMGVETWDIRKVLETGLMSEELLKFLVNCVVARMNILFCGEPGSGYKECAGFFMNFIPEYEKTVLVNGGETMYISQNQHRDMTEMHTENATGSSAAINMAVKLDPRWILLPEINGTEIRELLKCMALGIKSILSVRCSELRWVPETIANMADSAFYEQTKNSVYEFVDVICMVKQKKMQTGETLHYIDQAGFLWRDGQEDHMELLVKNGQFVNRTIPEKILEHFRDAEVLYPFENGIVETSILP